MSDQNTSLPVRTQTNGDVVTRISDGTTVSQLLGIDASGRVTIKLDDGSGNAITSQANGAQRALDVGIDVAGVQIDPRSIRALTSSDVVTANQGTANTAANGWFTKVTDGTSTAAVKAASTAALAADPSLVIALSPNTPLPAGANLLGSVNQGTSPWIVKDNSDGPVTPGIVAANSSLIGGQFNTALPTLTNGQQSALQSDASGRLLVGSIASALPAGTNLLGGTNVYVGGTIASGTNPLPVSISAALVGISINNYNTAAALAAAGTSNHIYTVTTSKTFEGKKIHASASGKLKIEVQTSPDGSTYSTLFVGFNSTATPNIDIDLDQLVFLSSGTGSTVRVIRTNLDLLAQDVYSTICGVEV